MIFRRKKPVAATPDPDKKTNIYVSTVLDQLIVNLERDSDKLNLTLANQAGYFHLIIPKDLSQAIEPDWIAIRYFVGFDDTVAIFDAERMRAPIRERARQFTPADVEKLMTMLYDLKAKLNAELNP